MFYFPEAAVFVSLQYETGIYQRFKP